MTAKRPKSAGAFTLVEIMAAILILSIALFGASGYRYYAALDARKATKQMTAARVCLLLCESWRGVKGSETYDPTANLGSDLTITTGTGLAKPDDFTLLGSYIVVANGVDCYVTMSWKDIGTGLRALNVIVAWPQTNQVANSVVDTDKSFELTTYTSN